jgi:hypothetical protein
MVQPLRRSRNSKAARGGTFASGRCGMHWAFWGITLGQAVGRGGNWNAPLIGPRSSARGCILPVLQVHIGFYGLRFYGAALPCLMALLGDLGVELFFVLSGFLIGALLLEVSERSTTLQRLAAVYTA